uniref:Holliday junction resolvase RuvX n=1 Tax=candidate division CPR3 bacterium TaxID=2268181 RepID=A0A7C5URS4_UNCC3
MFSIVNILGIDYGERYIGLAVKTDEGIFPLDPIDSKTANRIEVLRKVVDDYNISKIVIGIPLGNEEGEKNVKNFSNLLKRELNIDCVMYDESMTSAFSEEKIKLYSSNSKNIKTKVHSISAYLILKSFLNLE